MNIVGRDEAEKIEMTLDAELVNLTVRAQWRVGGKHIYSTIPLFYFQITPQKKREPVL